MLAEESQSYKDNAVELYLCVIHKRVKSKESEEILTGLLKAGRGGKEELEVCEDANHCSVGKMRCSWRRMVADMAA